MNVLRARPWHPQINSLKWAHWAKQLKALPGRTWLPSWELVPGCWRLCPSRGQILLKLVPRPWAEPEATAHAKMLPFWTSWSGSSSPFLFSPCGWPVPCAIEHWLHFIYFQSCDSYLSTNTQSYFLWAGLLLTMVNVSCLPRFWTVSQT